MSFTKSAQQPERHERTNTGSAVCPLLSAVAPERAEAGAAGTAGPSLSGPALAFSALLLLFISTNFGAIFFKLRGLPAGQIGAAVLCYQAGILAGALILDSCPGLRPGTAHISGTTRSILAILTALPSAACLAYFRLIPTLDVPLVNVFLFFLWGAHLAVLLRFSFRHAPPEKQALYMGIAMGAGHLCWSLTMPMAEGFEPDAPLTAGGKEHFLHFLNMARALIGLVSAAIVWRLSATDTPENISSCRKTPVPDCRRARRIGILMLPLVLCFTLNGIMGYVFLSRSLPRGAGMEYAHLALALLLPLSGMFVARNGVDSLLFFIGGAALCFLLSPLTLLPSVPPAPALAAYLACVVGQQVLIFSAIPALARFQPQTRHPALLLSLPWLCYSFSVTGNIAAEKLFPLLGLSAASAAGVPVMLCAGSILLLRRAFPLPKPAVPQGDAAAQRAKLSAFIAAFALSAREAQVLAGIIRRLPIERIGTGMGITERTVRFHQTGLFKKTNTLNRRRLTQFYSAWKPDEKSF